MKSKISILRPRSLLSAAHGGGLGGFLRQTGLAMALQRHGKPAETLTLVSMANEEQLGQVSMVGIGNELDMATEDGWALLAKYGDWPHALGIQRLAKPQAEEMVAFFNKGWNRVKRALVGSPIYRGHPDIKGLENQHRDKTIYGSTTGLQAREDGLYYRPVLTPDGADQVLTKGAKYSSAHWLARELPPENGRKVFAPCFLVSVGLTPTPNIPNQSLANANPENNMNPLLARLIALLALGNESTEDQVVAHVTQLKSRPESTALANEQTARTAAETQITQLKAQLETANTALANERTALANSRKAQSDALIAAAIGRGAITEAQKPLWQARLASNFDVESVALGNEKPGTALKTTPATAALGQRKAPSEAGDKFTALVNEAMSGGKLTYDAAWQKVKGTAEGKALMEEMNKAQE